MKMKDVILITGATRGIGRKTAELFLEKGFIVAGIYKKSDEEASFLKEKYENFYPYKADVGNEENVKKAVSDIIGKFGKIDCVINNAGISEARLLQKETLDSYDRILLCSDGLTNHVSNERIGEIMSGSYLAKPTSYKARVDKLIDEANAAGGLDNITAVLFGGE